MSETKKAEQTKETKETAAEQRIGKVFLDAVTANFPKHREARQRLAEFAQNKDALIAAEPDEAKRRQMLEEGRREYAELERETMTPVFQAVNNAVAAAAKAKGLSAVFSFDALLYGGIDITEEAIKELNK